jgi:hypothetical protein
MWQLLEEVDQLLAARWVAQLALRHRPRPDDACARDPESLAHLLQCPLTAIIENEAELQHTSLAQCQRVKDVLDFNVSVGASFILSTLPSARDRAVKP